MSKQPKALGLADALETISRMGIGTKHDKEIAIELRRQHAEIERLQDVNKNLLSFCKKLDKRPADYLCAEDWKDLEAAISKATGEQA